MNTEITEKTVGKPTGWIMFDAECRLCLAGRRLWGRIFERRGFVWVPLQTPGMAERLGLTPEELRAEMWVLPAGGAPVGGVRAWSELMRHVGWLKPLALALRLPGIAHLSQAVYGWIARNRYCVAGRCRIFPRHPPKRNRHSAFFEFP